MKISSAWNLPPRLKRLRGLDRWGHNGATIDPMRKSPIVEFKLRLTAFDKRKAKKAAKSQNRSLNQYIVNAIGHYERSEKALLRDVMEAVDEAKDAAKRRTKEKA